MLEFRNVCEKCGAKNTLWPEWKGKKRFYRCEACGKIAKGITISQWRKRK